MSTQEKVLAAVDKALSVQQPVIDAHLQRVRRGRPDAPPGDIVKRLNKQLLAATTSSGAAVGAAAAAPGVGTGVALALGAGESVAFLEAAALYALALSSIHGIHVSDLERRRTVFLAIMLGEGGAASVHKVAERTGQHWARQVVQRVPMSQINAINKVLGHNFVTKYGTKQGIVVLGRTVPFGIGALIGGGANATMATMVIRSARRAFGPPPPGWPTTSASPAPDGLSASSPPGAQSESAAMA
jgi:hypothetical protein